MSAKYEQGQMDSVLATTINILYPDEYPGTGER